ncbi:uncharacterized protein [Diabrotica undecimpunctata]|uniref:uncharacterized protein n=1 Tax=Diabrotica undecimpunctata TaxID=50387 RepID=UPI003B642293
MLKPPKLKMSSINTKLPQVSRGIDSESHTEQSVSLMDSGGSKYSTESNKKNYPSLLRIATYKIRTMRTQEYLDELEQELSNIKWDIIGLCETRLPGETCTILKSGHQHYQKNSVENHHIGSVAFLINKRVPYKVTKFCAVSNRFIYLVIALNSRYSLQIIHGYTPTVNSTDEDLTTVRNQEKSHFVIITGDFNAKIGTKKRATHNISVALGWTTGTKGVRRCTTT